MTLIHLLLVEDNERLRTALQTGLEATGHVRVIRTFSRGEAAVDAALSGALRPEPEVALLDVQLAGRKNGIETAAAIRRELPRFPVVFYSIQDDDAYYRDFLGAGILTHYAYVRKSNYLLPEMILPLLRDAVSGRSFIDPDIETRVQEVRQKDAQDPMALLEPHEQTVARMLADGLTNEQIAARMGYRDKRTISRINGQIYQVWGLKESATDEKIARTRAALIVRQGRMMRWRDDGAPLVLAAGGRWVSPDEDETAG